MKSLKSSLSKGEKTTGSWITLSDPAIAEIMANAGFDWLTVDLEHSSLSLNQAAELIRTITLSKLPALVRLTSNNADQIKQIMDAGATGIIVPMVNSAQAAQKALNSLYYPPRGKRGVGLARAQGYGAQFEEYKQWLEKEAICIVQIEHIEAVENAEEIFSVDGIDGYILGPYDLSASMGLAGQIQHASVLEAIKTVRKIAHKKSIPGGLHIVEPDVPLLKRAITDGFIFNAFSVDTRMLDVMCRKLFNNNE